MQANDLRAFADNLDASSFRALSAGIGLGAVKPTQAPPQTLPRQAAQGSSFAPTPVAPTPVAARSLNGASSRPMKVTKPSRQAASHGALKSSSRHAAKASQPKAPVASARPYPVLGWERKLMAWGLDLVFVGSTLAVLVALVTLLAAARSGETNDVFTLAPIQWLTSINPLELVGGVYGLYFAYILLFKLVAGVTLGESLLRARLARAP